MKIIGANITGSFILNNQDVTNTLQSSSVWSGSVAAQINSLNAASASLNSATASLSSATASLYAATASLNSATASLNTFTASAATTGSNTFVGNQTISGSLIPAVNITYDLGSSSNRWKDLYLSGSTIYLGEAILSATTGGIQIKNASGSYQSIIGSSLQISGGAVLTMDTSSGIIKMLNTETSSLNMPVEFSGSFSGSFFGTSSLSSQSISASYSSNALTASYANNASTASYLSNYIPPFPYTGSAAISGSLTVTGNITAQTLIVQTITSSQDFITGSTRFGSISANTHQFTGSVSITGSLNVNGIAAVLSNQTSSMTVSAASTATSASYAVNASTAASATSAGSATSASYAVNASNGGVTSIVAGTGTSINQGTGAVTVSIGQSVATSSTPTFGGLYLSNGVSTGRSSYGIANANLILYSSTTDSTGYCGIDFRSGNNYPSDGAQIYFENNAGGSSEKAKLTIRVENDLEDYMELRAGNITLNANTVSGGGQNPSIIFQNGGSTISSISSGGVYNGSVSGANITSTSVMTFAAGDRAFECAGSAGISFYSNEINAGSQGGTGDLYLAWRRTNSVNIGQKLVMGTASGVQQWIRMGIFSNSTTNTGEAWIGRASDRNAGTMTVQLGGNSASGRSFEVVDYAWTVVLFSVSSGGTATASGDVVAYSDARIKANIKPIESSLDKVLKLTGVTYNRTDVEDKSTKIGFIAQEVEKVVPEVVTYNKEQDRYGVSYGNVTALLVEAVKEQQSQIEELKSIINGLTK